MIHMYVCVCACASFVISYMSSMFGSLDGKTIGTNPTSASMNRASRIKNGKLHVWISPAKTQNPLFRKNHEQSTKHVDDSESSSTRRE